MSTRHSVAFELKALTRPAPERDVIFFGAIDATLGAISLKHIHPSGGKKVILLASFRPIAVSRSPHNLSK